MALLDPHLPSLSQYWLAALLDHAHLTLPPQFSRQLPPSGGTFYSTNVAENVKPYFEHNWPSLLHAAAIWLRTTGLRDDVRDKNQEEAIPVTLQPLMPEPLLSTLGTTPATSSIPLPPLTDPKKERFHLVLGLAVKTLCTPATLDAPSILIHCLKTLNRLLEANYVQNEIKTDATLAIEILHLLHRLLLTCQSHDLHVIVMQIAVLLGHALQPVESIAEKKVVVRIDSEDYEKTPMFALLEVSGCCLLRLVPELRSSSEHSSGTADTVSNVEMTVASHAVSLVMMAVGMCSVAETVDALPTILHILLHTVNFASVNQSVSAPLLSSCVRSLQQLVSHLSLTHPTHGHTLALTLRSSLSSLLLTNSDFKTTPNSLTEMEREVKLLVVTVLLHAPSPLVCPPGSQLFTAATQLYQESLFASEEKVFMSTYFVMVVFLYYTSNQETIGNLSNQDTIGNLSNQDTIGNLSNQDTIGNLSNQDTIGPD